MDFKKLEDLLEKYWMGDTDLHQESELRKYLLHPDLPEKYNKEALLFRYFEEERNLELEKESMEGIHPERDLMENKSVKFPSRSNRIKNYSLLKMAAVISTIAVSSILIVNQFDREIESTEIITDTFDNPEKAYEETKKALLLLSAKFGKGRKQVEKISIFSESQEKVQGQKE